MKRKPWAIVILAFFHILAPIGNLVMNAKRAHHTISYHWLYWIHFMPKALFLSSVVLPIIAGVMIYICKRWSYWVYLGCLALIFVANIYSFYTMANLFNFLLLMGILAVDVLAVAYFVVPAVRQVYFDPRLRWWEAAPRYIFSNPVTLNDNEGGSIKNISEGGLFVLSALESKEGDLIKLKWAFEGVSFEVNGKIVFKSARSNFEGFGVQFEHTSLTSKQLKLLCAKLRQRGQIVPDRLPQPEDSFVHWLMRLVTSGQGLFPKR